MHNSYQTPSENPTRAFKEKAMAYGTHSLTDAELLAMLLQIPLDSAKEIYHHLIPENKKALFGMSVDELSSLKGMGKSTATKLKGILDFGKRIYESKSTANKKINSSKNAYDHMLPFLIGQEVEYFYAIFISRTSRLIKLDLISQGGMAGTVVGPKVVFKRALINRAHSIILVHNHPSGDFDPSEPKYPPHQVHIGFRCLVFVFIVFG